MAPLPLPAAPTATQQPREALTATRSLKNTICPHAAPRPGESSREIISMHRRPLCPSPLPCCMPASHGAHPARGDHSSSAQGCPPHSPPTQGHTRASRVDREPSQSARHRVRCFVLGRLPVLARATTASVTPGWWPLQYHGLGGNGGSVAHLACGEKVTGAPQHRQELQLQVPSPCTAQGLFLGS